MQVALISFARDVLGIADATSEEFDSDKTSKNHVIIFMPEISKETMGANMRLGARWVEFTNPEQSLAASLYGGQSRVMERHRHRYEFNIAYKERMESKGLVFSGQDETKELQTPPYCSTMLQHVGLNSYCKMTIHSIWACSTILSTSLVLARHLQHSSASWRLRATQIRWRRCFQNAVERGGITIGRRSCFEWMDLTRGDQELQPGSCGVRPGRLLEASTVSAEFWSWEALIAEAMQQVQSKHVSVAREPAEPSLCKPEFN
eukprot:symbB.v1.2.018064.t1/scaffold1427.1/size119462/4